MPSPHAPALLKWGPTRTLPSRETHDRFAVSLKLFWDLWNYVNLSENGFLGKLRLWLHSDPDNPFAPVLLTALCRRNLIGYPFIGGRRKKKCLLLLVGRRGRPAALGPAQSSELCAGHGPCSILQRTTIVTFLNVFPTNKQFSALRRLEEKEPGLQRWLSR